MAKAGKTKKKSVKVEAVGQAHIQASFNKIIISFKNNGG
jgi:small subunit ribosomal protein S11